MDYILEETNLVQIKTMEKLGNSGTFVIEPLSPGYGVTLGNSLRRVLLSSLAGAAITSVKIEGASHEFAALPGVREDNVELILNLKALRFRMKQDEPVVLKLNVKGPKEVTASDFVPNAGCEVVDSDAFIASVGKGGKLSLEVTVENGRGYVPVEHREAERMPLGTVAVDSIFTPVKKIHYEVENTRVGGMTNFDKLTLEITTDGSIDPEIALKTAAQILIEHFNLIHSAFSEDTAEKSIDKKTTSKAKTKEKVALKKVVKKSKVSKK